MKIKVLKYTGIILLAVLVLIAVLLGLAASPPGERIIKGWIEDSAQNSTGLHVSIGTFETNALSRVQLNQCFITTIQPTGCDTILYLSHLRLDYSLWSLIIGDMDFESILLDTVTVCLARDSSGRYGIPAIDTASANDTATDTAAFDLGLTIGDLAVNALNIKYDDELYSLGAGTTRGKLSAEHLSGSDYRFSMQMDDCHLVYDSMPIDIRRLAASGTWTGESIALDSLVLVSEELTLSARAELAGHAYDRISSEITISGPLNTAADLVRSYWHVPVTAHEGAMNAWMRVEGSTDEPSIQLQLDLPPLTVHTAHIDHTSLIARYAGDTAFIDTLIVALQGGRVGARGRTRFDSSYTSSYNLTFDNLSAADLWALIYDEPALYTGRLSGDLDISGAAPDPLTWHLDSRLQTRRLTYQNKDIPDLQISMTADSGLMHLALQEGDNTIDATARLSDKSVNGTFDVSIPDLAPLAGWLNQPEISGSFAISGRFSGERDNPSISADLVGSGIRYQNFPVDSVRGQIRYADTILTVETLSLGGLWQSTEHHVAPFGLDSLDGTLNYAVALSGNLEHLRGNLRAALTTPRYGAYALDSADLLIQIDGSRIDITDLDFYRDHLKLSAVAEVDTVTQQGNLEAHFFARHNDSLTDDSPTWDPSGDLVAEFALTPDSQLIADATVSNLQVGDITRMIADTLDLSGLLSFHLGFQGTLSRPTADLSLTAREIVFSGTVIDSIAAQCELSDDRVNLADFQLYALNHKAGLYSTVGLRRDPKGLLKLSDSSTIQGALDIDSLDLSLIRPFLPSNSDLTGVSTTHVSWEGTIGAPILFGSIDIWDGRYLFDPESLPVDSISLTIDFRDSLVTLTGASALIERMPVSVSGTATFIRPDRVNLDLAASLDQSATFSTKGYLDSEQMDLQVTMDQFNLQVVRPFVTYVDSLDGSIQCRLDISGPYTAPQVDGYLTVADLMASSPEFFTRIDSGSGSLRFDRHQAVIDSLRAKVNGGRASLEGHISYDSTTITGIDLTLSADSVRFQDPDNFITAVDMVRLNYLQQDQTNLISGDIHLGETRLTRGLPLKSILPWVQSIETVDMELPEMLELAQLDVRIRESDNLWVDNNLARIRLHAELGVIGSPVQPNFSGMLEIKEGYLLYLDRKFKVTSGRVFFVDPARFNPDILLTASTQVSTYQHLSATRYDITFDARGPLDQLKIELTSEPPLDEPDIVALLTLGSTRSQLTGTDGEGSGAKNALVNRATMLSSRKVAGYVSDKVGSFFGFDEFTVEGNLFQFDRSWGPQLLASRRISDRLELSYTTTVGRLNDQTVRLEYRFTPRFSLRGQTDRQGRSLLDFKYGFRFK